LTEYQPLWLYLQPDPLRSRNDFSLRVRTKAMVLLTAAQSLAAAVPARAATMTASVNATVNKPLVLSKVQDLDLGTVTLSPGVWSNATVSISQAGALTCGSANIVCTGATMAATYNVQGSKQQAVRISVPNVTLVNQSDSSKTLTLTTNAPATITLANSGFPGSNFSIGGSVTLNSSTPSGVYVGTMNVTVDY
jgi:spore coat protein U-like protein